jgi:hypothetical protein
MFDGGLHSCGSYNSPIANSWKLGNETARSTTGGKLLERRRLVAYQEGLRTTKFVGHSMITKNADFISILWYAFMKHLSYYGNVWHNEQ